MIKTVKGKPRHCKHCIKYHQGKVGTRYEHWCAKLGRPASRAVGDCRLHKAKES